MFASTHRDLDENTDKLLQAHKSAAAKLTTADNPTAVQESATKAADASVHAEVPSGPSLEIACKAENGPAESAATKRQAPVSAQVSGT